MLHEKILTTLYKYATSTLEGGTIFLVPFTLVIHTGASP